jgi:hypothetical protein
MHDDRRIRIREDKKLMDPVDPDSDPVHCKNILIRLRIRNTAG